MQSGPNNGACSTSSGPTGSSPYLLERLPVTISRMEGAFYAFISGSQESGINNLQDTERGYSSEDTVKCNDLLLIFSHSLLRAVSC